MFSRRGLSSTFTPLSDVVQPPEVTVLETEHCVNCILNLFDVPTPVRQPVPVTPYQCVILCRHQQPELFDRIVDLIFEQLHSVSLSLFEV